MIRTFLTDHAVQNQYPPEKRILENHEILNVGLRTIQDFTGFEGLLKSGMEGFGDPVGGSVSHSTMPRFCSEMSLRAGLKYSASTSAARSGRQLPHMKMSNAA